VDVRLLDILGVDFIYEAEGLNVNEILLRSSVGMLLGRRVQQKTSLFSEDM